MTHDEMNRILQRVLDPQPSQLPAPSEADWRRLSAKFGCDWGLDFRLFMEFMAIYRFPGEIYEVSQSDSRGHGSIALVYDLERELGTWDPRMVPFYGIGNGDYFCLNAKECPESPVYYFYAERGAFDAYCTSFGDWVRALPEFLAPGAT